MPEDSSWRWEGRRGPSRGTSSKAMSMGFYSDVEYNPGMTGPLTTRSALLQVLRQAPGYGSELIRRYESASGGRLRLAPARVYPVLKELQAEGLVEAVRLAPKGRRGGRTRIYYGLT